MKLKAEEDQAKEEDKTYLVYSSNGELVLETKDIFVGLDKLKAQPPGAKLTRSTDGKTLAYTTAPRPEDNWMYNIQ